MKNSTLSQHSFKKGTFITPFNEIVSELSKEESWFYGRFIEYVWLGLVIDYYGRKEGLKKCNYLLNKLHEKLPDLNSPTLSAILELSESIQSQLYQNFLNIIEPNVFSPLTILFTYSNYPCFSKFFLTDMSVDDRVIKLNSILEEGSNHQSDFSTDIRFLVLYYSLLSGKLKMQRDIFDKILKYPYIEHSDEEMRMIRPTIRATEIGLISLNDSYNEEYINRFWEGVSKVSECEVFFIDIPSEQKCVDGYMKQIKVIMNFYKDFMVSSCPLDNKMLVLLGIATYSYKRILEIVEHDLFCSISGRSSVRVLIENYIMMKYLIRNEKGHKDIWTEYQYYGIGQYKLIVERYKETKEELNKSHVMYEYMDLLVSEYKNKEFINMDTSYFDKKNVRAKAIEVGEKDSFGLFYDYDSAYEHGLWGAIRESSLLKCNIPSHQYHCVPDVENQQQLKSVWSDCQYFMNKIIDILKKEYGLPEHLDIKEEEI